MPSDDLDQSHCGVSHDPAAPFEGLPDPTREEFNKFMKSKGFKPSRGPDGAIERAKDNAQMKTNRAINALLGEHSEKAGGDDK